MLGLFKRLLCGQRLFAPLGHPGCPFVRERHPDDVRLTVLFVPATVTAEGRRHLTVAGSGELHSPMPGGVNHGDAGRDVLGTLDFAPGAAAAGLRGRVAVLRDLVVVAVATEPVPHLSRPVKVAIAAVAGDELFVPVSATAAHAIPALAAGVRFPAGATKVVAKPDGIRRRMLLIAELSVGSSGSFLGGVGGRVDLRHVGGCARRSRCRGVRDTRPCRGVEVRSLHSGGRGTRHDLQS